MSSGDFDLEELADYLHLDRAQVQRLAERGKLPGRKVGGAWRFARGEIHQWLEARIGLSDSAELERVEAALERAGGGHAGDFVSLAELLPFEAVAIPLPAKTRNAVITAMVDLAAGTGWLWDPLKLEEAVRQREDMHTTALDSGVALLHPRRPMPAILERPLVCLGRTDRGIPFSSTAAGLTDIFFLICSVDDRGHLRTLARLSRLLSQPDFVGELRAAADASAARQLIVEREEAMTA